jgi:hypothetical protein
VFSMKLLTTFMLLTGIFAQECSLGDLGLEDFADKVVVTNVSTDAGAEVVIKFNHGQLSMHLDPGTSGMAILFASTDYTATVTNPRTGDYTTYRDTLVATRDWLRDLSTSAYVSSDSDVITVWTQLVFVQEALSQMTESDDVQSCGGKLKTDVTSLVTLQWLKAADGTEFWALDCG